MALIIQVWGKESTSHQQMLVKMFKGELRSVDESQKAKCQLVFQRKIHTAEETHHLQEANVNNTAWCQTEDRVICIC